MNEGRISWRRHVLERIAQRGLRQEQVVNVLLSGEGIEDYPDDSPFPSVLFLGFWNAQPIHVVASFDEENDHAYIITAYEPSLDVFEADHKTRKVR